MAKSKYADGHAGVHALIDRPDAPRANVDLTRLVQPATLRGRLVGAATPFVIALFRRLGGVRRVGGFLWVTRDADVRAALADSDAFAVPYGPEMADATGTVMFGLGDDGTLHRRHRDAMDSAFAAVDLRRDVREPAARVATALLDDSGGTFDLVGELLPITWAHVAAHMVGLDVRDHKAFSDGVIAVSADIFGNPYGASASRAEAERAARILDPVFSQAADRAVEGGDGTILSRMARVFEARLGEPCARRPL